MQKYEFYYTDLIPYILLFSIGLICYSFRYNRKVRCFYLLYLFLFAALRYGIGYDYFFYLPDVENFKTFGLEWTSDLTKWIAHFSGVSQLYFVINSLIVIYCVNKANNILSRDPMLSLLSYVFIPMFFLDSLGIIRNASAVAVGYLSYAFLKQNKMDKYWLCVFISGGFHFSGYIVFLFYFLDKVQSIKFINVCLVVTGIIFTIWLSPILKDFFVNSIINNFSGYGVAKIAGYIDKDIGQGSFSKFVQMFSSIALALSTNIVRDKKSKQMIFLTSVGMLIWGVFSFDHTLSLRLSSYFLVFQIVAFPDVISSLRLKSNRSIAKFSYILYLHILVVSLFAVNISGYRNGSSYRISFLPYQTIFNYTDYSNYRNL